MFNFFKRKNKVKNKLNPFPIVTRVWCFDDLNHDCMGSGFWDGEFTNNPEVIEKIYHHLKTAYSIRFYITNECIEYTAETQTRGQVSGACHRRGYWFFDFGVRKSGHRWTIYNEDRTNPIIKEFYDWWGNLVKPYEEEFDKDYNL